MKPNFLIFLSGLFLLSGCTTTQYYTGAELSFSEKAIVLTQFSGDGILRDVVGLRIASANPESEKKQVMFDRTKMEFVPGYYEFEVEAWVYKALLPTSLIGAGLGSSGMNVYLYGGSNSNTQKTISSYLEAGKIYILRTKLVHGEKAELYLTEY